VSLPLDQIVDELNIVLPDLLLGYPSVLHALALAAQGGTLKIAPRAVICASEPLLPEIREALDAAWGAKLFNWWATTEAGPVAGSCGFGPGMHLSDDLLIVEPVDGNGQPTQTGERAARVYVTNLFNPTLPLIRYELTDEVTFLDGTCPCGSAHQLVDDVLGRLDDNFVYPGIGTVHAQLFRSRFGQERAIVEYQVHQTPSGAEIHVRCVGGVGGVDAARLTRTICDDLKQVGLSAPQVTIAEVPAIERHGIGKLKRFLPLPTGGR
jgi:phenylacetate-coenzyme A ligase PaaK-like adenylate-forming protein